MELPFDRGTPADRGSGAGPETPCEAIYKGDSMRGAFVPGETLFLAETAFETLQTGDVVALFDRTPYCVHRIIEKNADDAVTMGDNNDRPDAQRLTRTGRFKLVMRAQGLDGVARRVAGGEAGMNVFRRQQRKRKLRSFIRSLFRPLRPLKFLRIPVTAETKYRDGTIQWSFGGIPVAARTPERKVLYLGRMKRLFFRIPKSVMKK